MQQCEDRQEKTREQFGTVGSLMARVWHIPGIKIEKENSKELRVAVFRAMRDRALHKTMTLGRLTIVP